MYHYQLVSAYTEKKAKAELRYLVTVSMYGQQNCQ